MAHRLVNQVQSARIRLVTARLGISVYIYIYIIKIHNSSHMQTLVNPIQINYLKARGGLDYSAGKVWGE